MHAHYEARAVQFSNAGASARIYIIRPSIPGAQGRRDVVARLGTVLRGCHGTPQEFAALCQTRDGASTVPLEDLVHACEESS